MGLLDREYMRRDYRYKRSKSDRPPVKRPKSRLTQKYYNLKRWVFRKKHPYSKLRLDELVINLGLVIGLSIILLIILSYSDTLNSIAIWFVELGTVIALILLYFIIKNLYKVFVNLRYGVRGLTNGVKVISVILLILVSWQIYQNQDDFSSSDSLLTDNYFNISSIGETTSKVIESGTSVFALAVDDTGVVDEIAITCDTPPSAKDWELYALINQYRIQHGLPKIPLSKSLTYVARTHVRDLAAHPPCGRCNAHSWSHNGLWTPCCYTPDHAEAECMWYKPKELTKYAGYGFECACIGTNNPKEALRGWKNSLLHNEVIINKGVWASHTWKSMGVGIYGEYTVIWFGEEVDPDGYWNQDK